ncbi:MAG: hypothetical protein JWM21_3078 [Acidobacteria bacterium]|nr:hypothetical protein [Acidobacteriota bacterium]
MAAKIEPLLTIEDLDACPDDGNRYELIGGELFVSRAPGLRHQRVLHNLQFEFEHYLKGNPIGIIVPGVGAVFSDYDAVIGSHLCSQRALVGRHNRAESHRGAGHCCRDSIAWRREPPS